MQVTDEDELHGLPDLPLGIQGELDTLLPLEVKVGIGEEPKEEEEHTHAPYDAPSEEGARDEPKCQP